MVRVQRIPLFPLNLVLFPNMPLPLHIFELRYRRMIRRCVEDKEEFGVILHTGKELTRVGCTAKVEGFLKEYADGRFDILSLGHERFMVRRFFEDQSHLEAEVQLGLSSRASGGLMSLAALEEFNVDGELLQSLEPEAISLLICGTGLFSLEEKQTLLEMQNTKERLERGVRRIEDRLKQRRAEKKIEELLGAEIDFSSLMN